ncbi:MAG: sugar ABC transporter substrate-binding protein [Nakamurella sp.]
MKISRVVTAITAVLIAGPLVLAGCSSSGSAAAASSGSSTAANSSAAAGSAPTQKTATFALVSHGSPGDSFWDVVKSGAEQAAKDLGVKVDYQSNPDPVQQSALINNAVAQKVDGLIVSMANPDGVKAAVEAAVAAGIPVITINSGLEQSKEFGAETHVGQSELIAGEGAGEQMAKAGLKNVICVIHEAGNTGLEDRCKGVAEKLGGKVTNIQVDVANLADAQNTIKASLLADPTIDGVLTLNNGVAVAASKAIDEAKSSAKLATFDVSADVTKLIEEGKILFAVDQQPYLQGYLPVVFLTLKVRNGDVVGGGQPVYSGPGYVTKENAAEVAQFAKNGTR